MTNEEFQKIILEELREIKDCQNRIENKLNSVYDQTANLTEFKTETNMRFGEILQEVKGIRKDFSTIEIVTASNYVDIAKLKAIK